MSQRSINYLKRKVRKMKKSLKKLLSLFLVLATVVSCFPIGVSAGLFDRYKKDVKITVKADKRRYDLGEIVTFTVKATNNTDENKSVKIKVDPKDDDLFSYNESFWIENIPADSDKTVEYCMTIADSVTNKGWSFDRTFSRTKFDKKTNIYVNRRSQSVGFLIEDTVTVEEYTQGLSYCIYIYNDNYEFCSVDGIGTATDTDIVIPPTYDGIPVTRIERNAFSNCFDLTSITLPDSVTVIDEGAFAGCTGLTSITVDEKNPVYYSAGNCIIETESKRLIVGCKNSIIPNDVKIIAYAFNNCTSLTSITIPESVTAIVSHAFAGCTGLTSITIPESVTEIEGFAFSGCSDLIEIIVDENNPVYHSAGNCVIRTESKCLIAGCNNSTIPNDGSVGIIDSFAFSNCYGLTSIDIPDSVFVISSCAFEGCTDLKSIIIPDSVIRIESSAFRGCDSLTNVIIPNSVTSIGYDAFSDCDFLNSVYFEDPNYWVNTFDGVRVDVSDPLINAETFKSGCYLMKVSEEEYIAFDNMNPYSWTDITHVSYDEIRCYDGSTKVMIDGEFDNTKSISVYETDEGIAMWGWVATAKEIKGFSYTVDGDEKIFDDSFKYETEQTVIEASVGTMTQDGRGCVDVSRFYVPVPLEIGKYVVKVYVEYTDGTSEIIWTCTANMIEHAHTPGDEATCIDPQICTVCGRVLTEAVGHVYGDDGDCINCSKKTNDSLGTEINGNKDAWEHICYVGYDAIFYGGNDFAVEDNITAPADREYAKLFGWIACSKPIKAFYYTIDGGEKVYDTIEPESAEDLPDFKFATTDDVLAASMGKTDKYGNYPDKDNGGITRFYIIAKIETGTQLIEAYVEYEDGTSEPFWAVIATRG